MTGLSETYRRWRDTPSTPTLAEFLPVYEQDDNAWWYLDGGHHMNLFDDLLEQAKKDADTIGNLRRALYEAAVGGAGSCDGLRIDHQAGMAWEQYES